jgi:hypothetical protein
VLFSLTSLANLVAPGIVLVSYELSLEYPSNGGKLDVLNFEDHTDYAYGEPSAPQDCGVDSSGVNTISQTNFV